MAVESQRVFAHEALGRHVVGDVTESLGEFFQVALEDPEARNFRWHIDRDLRAEALRRFAAESSPDQKLFLNVNPRHMVDHLNRQEPGLPWTLQRIQDMGIEPNRVVVEFTEESVGTRTGSLRQMVNLYRSFGCLVALDDVGAEASNLDRIGFFEPDIIKIDAMLLRRSLRERPFAQVLAGLRTIADGLGSALLFEGVETEQELVQCLRYGAQYLQGWYFGPAEAAFLPPDHFRQRLQGTLESYGQKREVELTLRDKNLGVVVSMLSSSVPDVSIDTGLASINLESLGPWTGLACRVFLTDRRGFQISDNYVPGTSGWISISGKTGSCRASRPYFAGTGSPNRGGSRVWSVSEAYYDVNDRLLIRTFGRQIGPDQILFVDVPEVENPWGNG